MIWVSLGMRHKTFAARIKIQLDSLLSQTTSCLPHFQIGAYVNIVDPCDRRWKITLSRRFAKVCLDSDVLELCVRNRAGIRNDQEDNSTRAFRKSAHRQFFLARHGHLEKGNRRV